jgi:hypothetical protein
MGIHFLNCFRIFSLADCWNFSQGIERFTAERIIYLSYLT